MEKATEIMLDVMEKLKARFDEAATKGQFNEILVYSEKLCDVAHTVMELRGSDINGMLEKVSAILREVTPETDPT